MILNKIFHSHKIYLDTMLLGFTCMLIHFDYNPHSSIHTPQKLSNICLWLKNLFIQLIYAPHHLCGSPQTHRWPWWLPWERSTTTLRRCTHGHSWKGQDFLWRSSVSVCSSQSLRASGCKFCKCSPQLKEAPLPARFPIWNELQCIHKNQARPYQCSDPEFICDCNSLVGQAYTHWRSFGAFIISLPLSSADDMHMREICEN